MYVYKKYPFLQTDVIPVYYVSLNSKYGCHTFDDYLFTTETN